MWTVDDLRADLRRAPVQREEVRAALRRALRHLEAAPWPPELPIELSNAARSTYSYRFHPGYILTFRQEKRMRAGSLIGIDLYLKSVVRAS